MGREDGSKRGGRRWNRWIAGSCVAAYCALSAGQSCPTQLPAGCYLLNVCTNLFYTSSPSFCYCEICWDLWQFDPPTDAEPGTVFYNPIIREKECDLRRSELTPEGCEPFNPCQDGVLVDRFNSQGIVAYSTGQDC